MSPVLQTRFEIELEKTIQNLLDLQEELVYEESEEAEPEDEIEEDYYGDHVEIC